LNQNTRQRIIGTVVLAIVAIILLPAIFDGESSYQSSLQTNIPDRPERPLANRELPQRPTIQADSEAIQVRDPLSDDSPDSDNLAPGAQNPTSVASDASSASVDADNNAETTSEPVVETVSSAEQPAAPSESASGSSAANDSAEPDTEVADAASNDEPGLDVSGLPEAWSVRVGAFGNASNAANLLQRLTDGGHRAYTRPVSSSGRQLTAVFVGPLISRQEAQGVLAQVKTDYDLSGMIVRYEIEGP